MQNDMHSHEPQSFLKHPVRLLSDVQTCCLLCGINLVVNSRRAHNSVTQHSVSPVHPLSVQNPCDCHTHPHQAKSTV